MEKKRILIITSLSPPSFAGGGRNAWHFARYLNSINQSNLLLTFNRNLKHPKKEIINGVKILRLPYLNTNVCTKIISFISIIWPSYLFHVYRSGCIYIIGANIIGYRSIIWIGKLFGKKVVFRSSLMGYDDFRSLTTGNLLSRLFNRTILRQIHTYISINPAFTKSLMDSLVYKGKTIEMSQGVDIGSFVPANKEVKESLRKMRDIPDDAFVVLSIGHIIRRKGYNESFDFLSRSNMNFIYIISGETHYDTGHFMYSYAEETAKLIESGKSLLKEKLRLIGPVEDIKEIYQIADLLLINSLQEGTPNVLLEAMSCGLPIICRDMDGITDYLVIHGKNGYIFRDLKSFIDGLCSLRSNRKETKEMGKHSRDLIERDQSMEKLYQYCFNNG